MPLETDHVEKLRAMGVPQSDLQTLHALEARGLSFSKILSLVLAFLKAFQDSGVLDGDAATGQPPTPSR